MSASPIHYFPSPPIKPLKDIPQFENVKEPPPDKFNQVYWNIFVQGIGSHFPWNVLLAGQKFFQHRLVNVQIARDFLSHFTIIFMSVKYAFLLSAIFLLRRFNPKWQVYTAITGNIFTFTALVTVCSSRFLSDINLYGCLLGLVLLASLFSALTEAGLLGILGQFPARYTQVFVAGHGFAGVIVIAINVTSYFAAGNFQSDNFAALYFGLSTGLLAISLLLFKWLQYMPFYRNYEVIVEEVAEARKHEVEENFQRLRECASFSDVYQVTKDYVWANFISTAIGYIIFPIFMFSTHSTKCGTPEETWFHKDMFVLMALVLANLFDFVGRFLPSIPALEFKIGYHSLFALARIILVPMYIFGNIKFRGYILPFKPFLANDYLFYALVSISALSSSYIGTVCMMWAPTRVAPKDRGMAIALIILSNALGFVIGSGISMGCQDLILMHSTMISK